MLRSSPLLSCLPSPWVRLRWWLLLFLLRLSLLPTSSSASLFLDASAGPSGVSLLLFQRPLLLLVFLTFLCLSLLLPSLFCSWPFLAPTPPGPAVPVDNSFAPGFANPSTLGPEPLLAPYVPDSVHAQICRLSVYIVCGFLCDFSCFYLSSYLPGLAWFPRVCPSLSDADNRLVSLSASGCPASSTLPQYTVHGDFSSSIAVPVNPSFLPCFRACNCLPWLCQWCYLLAPPACPTLGPLPVVASRGCWLSLRVCAGPSDAAEPGPTSLLLLCAG